MFYVYGWDRKTDDRVVLYENEWRDAAVNWAKSYTRGAGGTGGWDMVSVVYVYQDDIDWDNEPILIEKVIWSCWSEPMRWSDNAYEEF